MRPLSMHTLISRRQNKRLTRRKAMSLSSKSFWLYRGKALVRQGQTTRLLLTNFWLYRSNLKIKRKTFLSQFQSSPLNRQLAHHHQNSRLSTHMFQPNRERTQNTILCYQEQMTISKGHLITSILVLRTCS